MRISLVKSGLYNIKWVKKAQMWCKTNFDGKGNQVQKWASTKEELGGNQS